jgi:hypothetical protein
MDGAVTLQVCRDAALAWLPVCTARPGDPIGLAELDSRQTNCENPLMHALYLDQPALGMTARGGADDLLALFDDMARVAMSPPNAADREARPPIAKRRDLTATRKDMLLPKAEPSNRGLPVNYRLPVNYLLAVSRLDSLPAAVALPPGLITKKSRPTGPHQVRMKTFPIRINLNRLIIH